MQLNNGSSTSDTLGDKWRTRGGRIYLPNAMFSPALAKIEEAGVWSADIHSNFTA